MYDVTHVRMIETRLCDQKFLRMGKERLRSETSLGFWEKDGLRRDAPFLGELEEWRA